MLTHQAVYARKYNVAADTTKLTCCYFIPILLLLYCLDTSWL